VTRVEDLKINGVSNIVEKGFKAGIAISFGCSFDSFGEPGQKGKNLIRGDGFQISFTKFLFEATK
jgi:hypothetical protein